MTVKSDSISSTFPFTETEPKPLVAKKLKARLMGAEP